MKSSVIFFEYAIVAGVLCSKVEAAVLLRRARHIHRCVAVEELWRHSATATRQQIHWERPRESRSTDGAAFQIPWPCQQGRRQDWAEEAREFFSEICWNDLLDDDVIDVVPWCFQLSETLHFGLLLQKHWSGCLKTAHIWQFSNKFFKIIQFYERKSYWRRK